MPRHPTLSNPEIDAVEEAIACEQAWIGCTHDVPRVPCTHTQAPLADPETKPLAELEEFDRKTDAHLRELAIQKFGPPPPATEDPAAVERQQLLENSARLERIRTETEAQNAAQGIAGAVVARSRF